MRKKTKKHSRARIVLRLPDLDHSKTSVLNSLSSPRSRRNYRFAMDQFIAWYCSEPRLALNRSIKPQSPASRSSPVCANRCRRATSKAAPAPGTQFLP